MPLGDPGEPNASQWRIVANSTDSAGDYPVAFNVEATTDNPDAPAVPGIVQKFVDMIDASPDFRLMSAARTYSQSQPITPTG